MNIEHDLSILYETAAYDTALDVIHMSSVVPDQTFNEAVAILEAKIFKNKKELKEKLDKLEKSPKPIESLGSYCIYIIKSLLPVAGGFAGIHGIEALATAGKISATAAGPAMVAVSAISIIVFMVIDCCTRINRMPGSISDKKIQYKKILNAINESIKAWKRKDGDNAKKMLSKLEEAKDKVQAKLDALNALAKNHNLSYQNTFDESEFDALLSFDDIRLD